MRCVQLVEAAEAVGADIDFSSSYSLHKSLQRLKSRQEPCVRYPRSLACPEQVLEALATMGMTVAQYFAVCTYSTAARCVSSQAVSLTILSCARCMLAWPGSRPPNSWRHYALNIPYYTHFTSPIRRYADVLVHRMLQATLDGPEVSRGRTYQ